MRMIDELDDHCFALASEHIAELCREMEDALGCKPTVQDLCDLLAWGMKGVNEDIFEDVNTNQIQALKPKIKKGKRIKLIPGDVVSIPLSDGKGNYLALFIEKNRFGDAFGVFEGAHPTKPLNKNSKLHPLAPPTHSDLEMLVAGRWRVLGNYPDLLRLFDRRPEIFHAKSENLDDSEIGKWGSAENSDEGLRNLSKREAKISGLLENGKFRYSQGFLSENVEELFIKPQIRRNKKYGIKK